MFVCASVFVPEGVVELSALGLQCVHYNTCIHYKHLHASWANTHSAYGPARPPLITGQIHRIRPQIDANVPRVCDRNTMGVHYFLVLG